jgi:hypothetical protein
VGAAVAVQPVDSASGTTPVTVTFSEVLTAGITNLSTSSSGPAPPSGFSLGAPPLYYDVTTTAGFTPPLSVCIDYTGTGYSNESQLQLFHFEGGTWVDRTTSLDTDADTICAEVTSLSPFAIFEQTSASGALSAIQDSFLRSGADDTNEGANERLRIQNSGNNRVLVAFDLAGVSTAGLQSATLSLTIAENSDNWGATGRLVDAHRLLSAWTEGNGRNDVMVGGGGGIRGAGGGVTWHCAQDVDIANQRPNCSPLWNGGNYSPATSPGVLHSSGALGQVSWDVTSDVLAGASSGWIVKKREEGKNGQVRYYSREGAALAGDPTLAPRLVLEYAH